MEIVPFIFPSKDELIANSYLAIDSKKNCVLIDPSCKYDGIINFIKNNKLTLKAVLLTHGHFDHIKGLKLYMDAFNMPIYIDFNDVELLNDPKKNCSILCNDYFQIDCQPLMVTDKEILNILEEPIEVIETPYHTMGSVCYLFRDSGILFSGDTIFKMFLGRDDLPTSDRSLRKSSLDKLAVLDDDIKIYPGHGNSTTILNERRNLR